MNPSVGSTSNVNTNSNVNSTSTVVSRGAPTVPGVTPTTSQQSNATRTSVKAPLTATNRPNSNSQSGQQRPGNNYYPQNNRGKLRFRIKASNNRPFQVQLYQLFPMNNKFSLAHYQWT